MAKKKSNSEAVAKRRRDKEAKQRKINDIIAYAIAGVAVAIIVGLVIYSYC